MYEYLLYKADALVREGYLGAGYDTVVIDDIWIRAVVVYIRIVYFRISYIVIVYTRYIYENKIKYTNTYMQRFFWTLDAGGENVTRGWE